MQTARSARRRGFTLLEMMLVLVIIGVLAGVAAINIVGQADDARRKATATSINQIETALTSYNLETGAYPTTSEGLAVLTPRFLKETPLDGWNREFRYYSPTTEHDYVIVSAGKDAQFDTEDDVVSYDLR